MRSRNALPVRKVISWPSASRIRVIASSGLIWPVAGVEAKRIFIGIGPLIADEARLLVLAMDAGLLAQKSARPRSRPNVHQGEGARLRENFRDRKLRYVCNA